LDLASLTENFTIELDTLKLLDESFGHGGLQANKAKTLS
jgi:hypothetical protein